MKQQTAVVEAYHRGTCAEPDSAEPHRAEQGPDPVVDHRGKHTLGHAPFDARGRVIAARVAIAASGVYLRHRATMVLLVDDDPDLLEVLGLLLEHARLRHVAARSLREVEALDGKLDDLDTAILDVNLGPGKASGVEVAAWLCQRHPDARIVFMTGHAPDHPLVRAATGTHGQVLAKPIDARQLIRIARGEE